MKQELVDIGEGIKISRPIEVDKELVCGSDIHTSLSHDGILSIHPEKNRAYSPTD